MIRKLTDGRDRLYSRKKDPKPGKRRNLGTFTTRAAAAKHERAVHVFTPHVPGADALRPSYEHPLSGGSCVSR